MYDFQSSRPKLGDQDSDMTLDNIVRRDSKIICNPSVAITDAKTRIP